MMAFSRSFWGVFKQLGRVTLALRSSTFWSWRWRSFTLLHGTCETTIFEDVFVTYRVEQPVWGNAFSVRSTYRGLESAGVKHIWVESVVFWWDWNPLHHQGTPGSCWGVYTCHCEKSVICFCVFFFFLKKKSWCFKVWFPALFKKKGEDIVNLNSSSMEMKKVTAQKIQLSLHGA